DLLPVLIAPELVESIKSQLPELPDAKRARFTDQYGLSDYDADVLTSSAELADYFETATAEAKQAEPKTIANWVQGKVIAALNEDGLDIGESKVSAVDLGALVDKIAD
ncbi:MAG: Asp-tRNA(Asn)/Glu-tRNA(Gln) amidotransferase GatCAB subunit B, partial [Gammaproteobacteria bacterium]|nr:Asp-tRNA(Asn)/Glu-tRNA(Gln) amidotransferase GatCAB subunit B [Gammaproteobacteria bacterium]